MINTSPNIEEIKDVFKVYIRIRPLNQREELLNLKQQKKKPKILKVQNNSLSLYDSDDSNLRKEYFFDFVFDEESSTQQLFDNQLQQSIENVLNGFNLTIFAYGMTGAGKSHTMFGDIYDNLNDTESHIPGIVTLSVNELFAKKNQKTEIKISYLEIYNEQIRDLLVDSGDNLLLVEDQDKAIQVQALSEYLINSQDDLMNYVIQGNKRRILAATSFNSQSSRSHAIIQLTVLTKRNDNYVVSSKLTLVDLAGSERACVSQNRGERMREGANINKSLLSLGNCINILSDANKKGQFVPYRDSKLTRLLKDSLGGNTKTLMIACVSPSWSSYEETANTLKYAYRARNIKKKVKQNIEYQQPTLYSE